MRVLATEVVDVLCHQLAQGMGQSMKLRVAWLLHVALQGGTNFHATLTHDVGIGGAGRDGACRVAQGIMRNKRKSKSLSVLSNAIISNESISSPVSGGANNTGRILRLL